MAATSPTTDLKYDNCNVPSDRDDECEACTPIIGLPALYGNGTCKSMIRDGDNICALGHNYTASNTAERYRIMRDALQAQNRTIEYSICVWGYAGVDDWGNATGNSWRISTDIRGEFLAYSCHDHQGPNTLHNIQPPHEF